MRQFFSISYVTNSVCLSFIAQLAQPFSSILLYFTHSQALVITYLMVLIIFQNDCFTVNQRLLSPAVHRKPDRIRHSKARFQSMHQEPEFKLNGGFSSSRASRNIRLFEGSYKRHSKRNVGGKVSFYDQHDTQYALFNPNIGQRMFLRVDSKGHYNLVGTLLNRTIEEDYKSKVMRKGVLFYIPNLLWERNTNSSISRRFNRTKRAGEGDQMVTISSTKGSLFLCMDENGTIRSENMVNQALSTDCVWIKRYKSEVKVNFVHAYHFVENFAGMRNWYLTARSGIQLAATLRSSLLTEEVNWVIGVPPIGVERFEVSREVIAAIIDMESRLTVRNTKIDISREEFCKQHAKSVDRKVETMSKLISSVFVSTNFTLTVLSKSMLPIVLKESFDSKTFQTKFTTWIESFEKLANIRNEKRQCSNKHCPNFAKLHQSFRSASAETKEARFYLCNVFMRAFDGRYPSEMKCSCVKSRCPNRKHRVRLVTYLRNTLHMWSMPRPLHIRQAIHFSNILTNAKTQSDKRNQYLLSKNERNPCSKLW